MFMDIASLFSLYFFPVLIILDYIGFLKQYPVFIFFMLA